MRQPTSFRLDPDAIEDLEWLAKHLNLSQARVIEILVKERREREEATDAAGRLAELEERVARLESQVRSDEAGAE